MSGDRLDVVVVGAGISGLTAAFRLNLGGLRVAVLEAAARVGGAIETFSDGAWRFEMGPNTVVESDESVGRLIRDAGLDGEKIVAAPSAKRRYLYKGGQLVPLPGGPGGLLTTPLFSVARQAAAAARALDRPPSRRGRGEHRAIRPPASRHRVPRLRRRPLRLGRLRRRSGTAVGALGGAEDPCPGAGARQPDPRRPWPAAKGPAPGGAMISFREGLEALPRRLAREIGDVRTGVAAQRIVRTGTASGSRPPPDRSRRRGWCWRCRPTSPPASSKRSLPAPAACSPKIPYAAVAVVSLGWRREDVGTPWTASASWRRARRGCALLGCLFPSADLPRPRARGARRARRLRRRPDRSRVRGLGRRPDRRHGDRRAARPSEACAASPPSASSAAGRGRSRSTSWGTAASSSGRARSSAPSPASTSRGNFLGGVSVPDCIRNATALAEEIWGRPESLRNRS